MKPTRQLADDWYAPRPGRENRRLGNYVWLVYSLFFFIEPVLRHERAYWLQQMPIYAVVVGLYILYVELNRTAARLLTIAALLLTGMLDISFNQGASCCFIYVAALLPFVLESMPAFAAALVVELAVLLAEALLTHPSYGSRINYVITAFFIILVGVSNASVAQGKRADARLRRAEAENVELAAVAERERIARDLHDVLGHTLSVIVLKAELAGRLLAFDPARAAAEIGDVERTARLALAEVREAIGGYRSKGLSAEIEQARQTLDAAGVQLICPAAPPSLRPREETVLSLAVREAVTNIVRHARATECTVRFSITPEGCASLEVADDGQSAGVTREGNGLRGMRERVEELGGRFSIAVAHAETTRPGTRLHIEVPTGGTLALKSPCYPAGGYGNPAGGP